MQHRDPATGQFVSDDMEEFDDIEVVTFEADLGVKAGNLGGSASFAGDETNAVSGVPVIDYDEVVDRNEELHLLGAWHALTAWLNATSTADGDVRVAAEISASPTNTLNQLINGGSAPEGDVDGNVVGAASTDDTIDLVGRQLLAVGYAPFSDGSTGVGGAGSAGEDSYHIGRPPMEMGRFHPRDELFVNAQFSVSNVADQGVHADIQGQHWYGVVEE